MATLIPRNGTGFSDHQQIILYSACWRWSQAGLWKNTAPGLRLVFVRVPRSWQTNGQGHFLSFLVCFSFSSCWSQHLLGCNICWCIFQTWPWRWTFISVRLSTCSLWRIFWNCLAVICCSDICPCPPPDSGMEWLQQGLEMSTFCRSFPCEGRSTLFSKWLSCLSAGRNVPSNTTRKLFCSIKQELLDDCGLQNYNNVS